MKRVDIFNLRRLFSGPSRFRPLPSRRGFEWELPQIAQLVVDLELNARSAPDDDDEDDIERFFLGTINVSRAPHGAFIIHDGLQRLAVLSLFLAFARDRSDDARERQRLDNLLIRHPLVGTPEPRLRLSPEDHAWYAHFILPEGATRRLPSVAPLGSPKHLLLAARFMDQTFRNYSQDDLAMLSEFATSSTAVVRNLAEGELRTWAPMIARRRPEPSQYMMAAE